MNEPTSTRRWWSMYSRVYDLLWSGPITDRLAEAVARLAGAPGGPVVDVGCGTGLISRRLFDCGHFLTCVDPSAAMLKRLAVRIPGVNAVAGSVAALPIRKGSATTVVATNLLHLHPRPVEALTALMALLAPSGRLICSWPREDAGPWRLVRAEAAAGLSPVAVAARALGRIAIGLAAPTRLRRTPSADLRSAVASVTRRLSTAADWVELPEAEQTLVVIHQSPVLDEGDNP